MLLTYAFGMMYTLPPSTRTLESTGCLRCRFCGCTAHKTWSSLWQNYSESQPCQHCITCRPLPGPFVLLSDLSSRNSSATSPSLSCFSFALYQSSPCVHLSSTLQRSIVPVWCRNTLLGYYLYTPCCTKSSILQNRLSIGNSSSSLGYSSTCTGAR